VGHRRRPLQLSPRETSHARLSAAARHRGRRRPGLRSVFSRHSDRQPLVRQIPQRLFSLRLVKSPRRPL